MIDQPLVSIVSVVKNGEKFLQNALKSILNQTYQNYEIIVIDGHSTDKTSSIIKSYPQIRYFLQETSGIANAYNQGIDESRGEFIAFLSYDDLWTSDKLETQIKYLIAHPEIQYTVAKVKFFLEEGYSPPSGFKTGLLQGEHIGKIMETLLVRKQLFNDIGKLSPEFAVGNDTDWFARCQDANIPMKIIDKVLLYKRVHDSNLSLTSKAVRQDLFNLIKQSIERKKRILS